MNPENPEPPDRPAVEAAAGAGESPPAGAGVWRHPVAWVALAIAVFATAGGWYIAREHEDLAARMRFEDEAGRIQAALSQRLSTCQDVLQGGVGLFAASASVERSEWRAYVNAVSVSKRFPGVAGVGFLALVPRAGLDDFLRAARADQTPGFQVKNPGTNDDLLIIKYLEPEAANAAATGVDEGADPEWRRVAEKACDTGAAVISGPVNLDEGGPARPSGLVMMLPVYRNGPRSDTPAERRANIEGWVFARLATAQFMNGALNEKAPLLRFEALDREARGGLTPIFDTQSQEDGRRENGRFSYASTGSVAVGQRLWLLRFTATPAFEAGNSRGFEWLAAVGGGFCSLLIFGIALSLSSTRARAEAMAGEMTAAFRKANHRLQLEVEERKNAERRAAIQHSVTRVLAEADTVAAAAPKIVQALCESMGWDFGTLWRLDEPAKCLRCVETWRRPGLSVDEFEAVTRRMTYARDIGISGRVWSGGQPVWIKDVAVFPQFPRTRVATKAGLHAVFAFPVMLGDEFMGVAEFCSHQIIEPDAELLKLVASLGSQIGQFIGRERAQQELEREQFLLRTLMEKLPDRIYFKDVQSRFLRNSRAHLLRFGLADQRQALGKSDFDFFTVEHARQAFADEQELMQRGEPITVEEKETWPDGSVSWALSTKLPLRDESGAIVGTFGISRDITDRKRAEEAMRQAKEAAEEANRTKSQFLANMSHELRTPLNSVIGFAGILLKNKSGSLNATELNFLERIQANGKHLLVLINEILDLSKIEARRVELQLAPVALDVLIRDTLAQQEGLVRDRPVQLLADIPQGVAPIQADAEKLRQVIINLIGNALKFTERGSVTVRVAVRADDHKPVRIEVADTGIGIPRDKLGVIFEAFQQADSSTARKYGGTGLGLTISQALCDLMGFHIEVASTVGQGSVFSVVLQKKEDRGTDSGPEAPAIPIRAGARASGLPAPGDLRGKLVLVIDDESDSRTLLTHMLEEFGCQVIAANSGELGLRMAREFKPQIITVDLLMPQMDGAAVVRALKADPQLRTIPLVVVSIVAEERRGSILGVVDILEKPVGREELRAAIRRSAAPDQTKVLLVDDEEDARSIVLSHLAGEPIEVRTAANGQEALAALETFQPDLILLDLIMPVMDGLTFLDTIRADPRYQHLPVVVVTSKELSQAEVAHLRRQTLEIVKKTEISEEKFKHLLQRILKQAEAARGRVETLK